MLLGTPTTYPCQRLVTQNEIIYIIFLMQVFTHKKELQEYIRKWFSGNTIGFVPTMGALHAGHLSLIEQSKKKCDVTVCSIFVNPTQFNDPADLAKYPRPIEKDIQLLEEVGCDILYQPSVEDVYDGEPHVIHIDLGGIEKVLEGKQRPGHFDGVVSIVKKLFEAVKPTDVFFGQKDYQQTLVVRKLIRHFNMNIKFHTCTTSRENDGLAMSSRNIRLNDEERKQALSIHQVLQEALRKKDILTPLKMEEYITEELQKNSLMKVEYACAVDPADLKDIKDWHRGAAILVAVSMPSTRLIDNVLL